jgi:cysteine dioxygenase
MTERPTPVIGVLELGHRLARLAAAGEFTPAGVTAELRRVRVDPASLEPYLEFDRQRYPRQLLYRHDRFELLALCWEPGQRSAIHNHAGQECWMLAPVGCLVNQNYRVLEQDEAAGTCRLAAASACRIDPDHPYHVDPAEPVHRVENPAAAGQRAVSLHIYSLPYHRCLVYSLESGRYGEVELHTTRDFTRS